MIGPATGGCGGMGAAPGGGAGLPNLVADNRFLTSWSLTTIKRQHWVLAQDGAQRAASSTFPSVSSGILSDFCCLILLLFLIASKVSNFFLLIFLLLYLLYTRKVVHHCKKFDFTRAR
jgi:hypothetical protein